MLWRSQKQLHFGAKSLPFCTQFGSLFEIGTSSTRSLCSNPFESCVSWCFESERNWLYDCHFFTKSIQVIYWGVLTSGPVSLKSHVGSNFAIHKIILILRVGLYRTSPPVWKSGKFSKSWLSKNWTFSFLDARLLTLLKIAKKVFIIIFFFSKLFCKIFCLSIWYRNIWHQISIQGLNLMRIDRNW